MTLFDLLDFCRQQKATDLLLQPGRPPFLRLHGDVRAIDLPPLAAADIAGMVFDMLGEGARQDFLQRRICRFTHDNELGRFLVQLHGDAVAPSAVIRDVAMRLMPLDELGAPPALHELAEVPRGLVLLNGRTGSGSWTMLAALVHKIMARDYAHLVAIGETDRLWSLALAQTAGRGLYSLLPVGPRECARSLGEALDQFTHMDADVLYLASPLDRLVPAELRTVLDIAAAGHLVLAGLHAGSTVRAMEQLLWRLDPADAPAACGKIAEALTACVCQTLAITADHGGRIALHEILRVDGDARQAIRRRDFERLNGLLEAKPQNCSLARAAKQALAAGRIAPGSCERILASLAD